MDQQLIGVFSGDSDCGDEMEIFIQEISDIQICDYKLSTTYDLSTLPKDRSIEIAPDLFAEPS